MKEIQRPKIGIGVFVRKDGKVLMQRRIGSHNAGTWTPPGGHLEMFESFEACARKEVAEEAGIAIKNIRFLAATNDVFKEENKHYATLHFVADWKSGSARIMEPDYCDGCEWFEWGKLPKPLSVWTRAFLKTGINPLEF